MHDGARRSAQRTVPVLLHACLAVALLGAPAQKPLHAWMSRLHRTQGACLRVRTAFSTLHPKVALPLCPAAGAVMLPVVPGRLTAGGSGSSRPPLSWSPGTSFSSLLYETGEQGISVMGFGFSLGNRAKCVSLPSCFLKDAVPLPNSSEPGPHAA